MNLAVIAISILGIILIIGVPVAIVATNSRRDQEPETDVEKDVELEILK